MHEGANKADHFTATNWTIVLAAGQTDLDRAAGALESICSRYWQPVYVFVRRRGSSPHDAEDLTQAFFAHLLQNEALKTIDRGKGKFRSFLLASLTNFLNNDWQKQKALKRGGQIRTISWDEAEAEDLYQHEPVDQVTPEKLFERRWAFTVMEQVLSRLKSEHQNKPDKQELFEKLSPQLTREIAKGELAEIAAQLQMTEGAVKVALHRLRRRFGELLRSQVAYTVAEPDLVEEEIRHLFSVIAL
jgi:RNA polymerase sigma-70 factor (ECF subfamily)